MYSNTNSRRGSSEFPATASSTSTTTPLSKADTRGSYNGTPLTASSSKAPSSKGGTRASSIASSWKRRRPSFHVTSFALSTVCKLLTVYRSPPPLRSALPSTTHSVATLVDTPPTTKPLIVYGDIIGPHLCKVVIVIKELGLPYVLKVLDRSTVDRDPYTPTALARGIPALDDPNTAITLWESGAIVEYLEETYDKDNRLRYTSFPEVWHQRQWAWYQFGGHEVLLGRRAFICVQEYFDALIRGNLATIESHLASTGNLYLIGDKVSYADLMFIAAKEAAKTTLWKSFSDEFEIEWRKQWPRSYDWHQRLLDRWTVREFFRERARIIDERGWAQ